MKNVKEFTKSTFANVNNVSGNLQPVKKTYKNYHFIDF
jgi:hypothetical protein